MKKIAKTIFNFTAATWLIFGMMVVAFVVGDLLIGVGYNVYKSIAKPPATDFVNAPVYPKKDYPDVNAFWTTHLDSWNIHFEPYVHWRRYPFKSAHTNVSKDGIRFTPKSPKQGAQRIFMFGGSTMWGWGVADKHSIPSFLQQKLGENYDVYNYGETGYVSTQELNYLMYHLAKGNVPDTVIFYDGFNEGYAGVYSPGIPRDPSTLRPREAKLEKLREASYWTRVLAETKDYVIDGSHYRLIFKGLRKLRDRFTSVKGKHAQWEKSVVPKFKSNADQTVSFYEQNVKQIKALAKEYGFNAYFFWQPNLFSNTKKNSEYEKTVFKKNSPGFYKAHNILYNEAKARLSNREQENIFFIGDILNDYTQTLYYDFCHLGPEGNELVADAIYQVITSK